MLKTQVVSGDGLNFGFISGGLYMEFLSAKISIDFVTLLLEVFFRGFTFDWGCQNALM